MKGTSTNSVLGSAPEGENKESAAVFDLVAENGFDRDTAADEAAKSVLSEAIGRGM